MCSEESVPSSAELLDELRKRPLAEPSGWLIEQYSENFAITPEAEEVLVRFLSSQVLDTRDAALTALVRKGHRVGYEADALLVHLGGKKEESDPQFSGINFLAEMARNQSRPALRILEVLSLDFEWVRVYGECVFDFNTARTTDWRHDTPDARDQLLVYLRSFFKST